MTIVGVIPAAGRAVRLQPLAGSKEMIPVGGRPVIDYLVERMRAAGCEELRIVTRPDKHDVRSYAEGIESTVVLGEPATINDSIVLGLSDVDAEAIALLGFPDSLWEPVDGYRPLVEAVEEGAPMALGLFRSAESEGADAVELDGEGQIAGIEIKPLHPRSDWLWGAAAARVGSLTGLDEEEWPSGFVNSLLARGEKVAAIRLSDVYLDIGTHSSLRLVTEDGWTLSS